MWHAQQPLLLLVLLAALVITAAEPDCTVPQPIDHRAVKACCRGPKPDVAAVPRECMNREVDTQLSRAQDFWCKVECIFKATDAIKDLELNMSVMRAVIDKFYQHDQEYADAFYKALEECEPVIKSEVERYRQDSGTADRSFKCSPVPAMYIQCTQTNMLRHCPAKTWQSNDSCDASRAYLTSCGKEILDMARQRWTERGEF